MTKERTDGHNRESDSEIVHLSCRRLPVFYLDRALAISKKDHSSGPTFLADEIFSLRFDSHNNCVDGLKDVVKCKS